MIGKPKKKTKASHRSGVVATELAICLPILVLFAFASIELCSAIYLRQSLAIACYEGNRVATHSRGTQTDALAAANRILTERNISGGQIAFSPSDLSSAATGSNITITVSAPVSSNSMLKFGLFGSTVISSSCVMRKE